MRAWWPGVLLLVAGCGGSAVIRAADAGDIGAFRSSLNERLGGGDVDVDEAQDIATHLLRRQIQTAQGPSGLQALDSVEACAPAFERSLAHRAAHQDELAARAALVLMDAGKVPPMYYGHYVNHRQDYWRAVGARSVGLPAPSPGEVSGHDEAQRQRAGVWRRRLMADRSRQVRLAALSAAVQAGDPGDTTDLLEAGRLDPEPRARLVAIEALGAIATREAVLGLKDLWTGGTEGVRVAIVEAWAATWRRPHRNGDGLSCPNPMQHPSCEARHQLRRAAEQGEGLPRLIAALELIHWAQPKKADAAAHSAAAVVERMIDESSTRVQVEAISSAPLAWVHLLEAVVDASESKDDEVAVAALSRMTELTAKERGEALKKLRKLAKTERPAADAAKLALVKARDDSVVKLLDADANAKSKSQRISTAKRYAQLGKVNKALAMLGDKDPAVRTQAACAILFMDDD